MKQKYKFYMTWLLMIGIGSLFAFKILPDLNSFNATSYAYFSANTYAEIGAKNMVTGIYLDYRLFDSLLEAGILFVVTAGILFMSKKDEEVR